MFLPSNSFIELTQNDIDVVNGGIAFGAGGFFAIAAFLYYSDDIRVNEHCRSAQICVSIMSRIVETRDYVLAAALLGTVGVFGDNIQSYIAKISK